MKLKKLVEINVILFVLSILWGCSTVPSLPATTIRTNSLYNSETITVYAGPGPMYGEIGTIKAFTDIVITGRLANALESGIWVSFNFNEKQGWINSSFIEVHGNFDRLPEGNPTNNPVPLSSASIQTNTSYDIYAGPGENYDVIGSLGTFSNIIITGKHNVISEGKRNIWVTFDFNGTQGWIVDVNYPEYFVIRLPETK